MKISAINNFTNYSYANKNNGQRVNFGMFGTPEDAKVLEYGGMPGHKPEIAPAIARLIQPFLAEGFTKSYEKRPGEPISALGMLAESDHFLFYVKKGGGEDGKDVVGVQPIVEAFENGPAKDREEFRDRLKTATYYKKLPDRTIFNNMLYYINRLEYKKNFPQEPQDLVTFCAPPIRDGLRIIEKILTTHNLSV